MEENRDERGLRERERELDSSRFDFPLEEGGKRRIVGEITIHDREELVVPGRKTFEDQGRSSAVEEFKLP